ncbi:MAG: bifunctional glutamate N-acetyltransferase/amino-acid acetyltransferase ArgJ [Bacillota bacterium]|nr:bifunctional glutamate N-acetyltransferase/amino-acid acetyltransferase ArgJ [Bacillota bacterium]
MGILPELRRPAAEAAAFLEAGVTAPAGWKAAGVHAGLKRRRPDVALLLSERPAWAVATYTRNRVQAAPLLVTRSLLGAEGGWLRAVAVNSGNANACTGEEGLERARRMQARAAAALGLAAAEVAVASTGVIGVQLPEEPLARGLEMAGAALGSGPAADAAFARAIQTTDTTLKQVALEVEVAPGERVRIGGAAKGSGMIHPDMGTMLAFLTSDAELGPAGRARLAAAWRRAVERTFNRVTVDGDTSTNDMALLLVNGASGVRVDDEPEEGETPSPAPASGARPAGRWARWLEALEEAARHLARAIAADGEGASRLIEVEARGLQDEEEAAAVARTVAGSALVKSAVHGGDPNWGRVLAAAGRATVGGRPVLFDPERAELRIGGVLLYRSGVPLWEREEEAAEAMRRPEVRIELVLGDGPGGATAWGCDLSADYVRINAAYRT